MGKFLDDFSISWRETEIDTSVRTSYTASASYSKFLGRSTLRIDAMKSSEISEIEYFRETVPKWGVEASHPLWTWIPRRAMPWTGVMKQ